MTRIPITWHPDPIIRYDDLNFGERGPTRDDLPAGSARWHVDSTGDRHFEYVCPCGCQRVGCLPVDLDHHIPHRWQWDGNELKPTLTPSIFRRSSCFWHGYVTAGEWISC